MTSSSDKKPEVSIIIPTYNSQSTILETLDSVQNQTYTDYEVILVDDSSSDDTVATVAEHNLFKTGKLRLKVLSSNFGVAQARNEALKIAKGKYVAFVDADDTWYNNKLSIQIKQLTGSKFDFVFSNYDLMSDTGEIIGSRDMRSGKYDFTDFLSGNPAGMLTVVVNRKLLLQVGGFPDVHHEDYALWLTLTKMNVSGFLLENHLATYRVGKNQFHLIK